MIKTKYGESVLISFYLEEQEIPFCFNWEDIQVGNTMCVLYAHNKAFMVLPNGVRVEGGASTMVFPVPLPTLTKECDLLLEETPLQCFSCGKRKDNLKCCSKCHLAYYSSRECQGKHWKASHKKLCRHTRTLSNLMKIKSKVFNNYVSWSKLQS
jgi:hypothetical protein